MTDRVIPPVANAIAAGLQVPWIRAVILPVLRRYYVRGGCTQVGLARELGVNPRTVRRWFAADERLGADLDGEK